MILVDPPMNTSRLPIRPSLEELKLLAEALLVSRRHLVGLWMFTWGRILALTLTVQEDQAAARRLSQCGDHLCLILSVFLHDRSRINGDGIIRQRLEPQRPALGPLLMSSSSLALCEEGQLGFGAAPMRWALQSRQSVPTDRSRSSHPGNTSHHSAFTPYPEGDRHVPQRSHQGRGKGHITELWNLGLFMRGVMYSILICLFVFLSLLSFFQSICVIYKLLKVPDQIIKSSALIASLYQLWVKI